MKKRLFWATLVYVLSLGFFLAFMYQILNRYGFTVEIYALGTLILMGMGWMFGALFLSYILAPKERLDANLLSLTKEILHELNIPLSTIQANGELLKKKLEDEKSLKRLGRIEDASKRLERLYKELVYTIKKQLHPIEKEHFNLKPVLEERTSVLAGFHRNRFELELEGCIVLADKIGFEKMIDNLLMNAMKYSGKESPVEVHLKGKELHIIDQGVGMSETEILRIFERYYQADKAREGEGIGLALVKHYCDESQIEIQIKSQVNQGTKIILGLQKIFVS